MTTINLYHDQQEMQKKLSAKSANKGLIFSLGILGVTVLAYVGVKAAVYMVTNQNEKLMAKVDENNISLAGAANIKQVIDMQSRLEQIKSNLQIKNKTVSRLATTQVLDYLSADLNTGIFLTDYSHYSSGKVSLLFGSSSYADVAKQIMAFKNSDNFQDISITSISRGEKYISCGIDMQIKQQ